MKFALILTAAGIGKRIQTPIPKQFHSIKGKEIFLFTLERLTNFFAFDVIAITYPTQHFKLMLHLLQKYQFNNIELIEGGIERFHSVLNALKNDKIKSTDFVFVHDAVRPFVTKDLLVRLYDNVLKFNAVAPGIPIKDTLKEVDSEGMIEKTIDRSNLVAIQTPQAFKTSLLLLAYEKAINDGKIFTDDAGVVENYGHKVKFIEGEEVNIKITTPSDLLYAEFLALHNY